MNRRPRVCVVRQGFFPDDPRVRKEVLALLDRGFAVDVVCLRRQGEARRETWRGARVHRLPVPDRGGSAVNYALEYGLFFLLAFGVISALHLRRRFDVVQTNTLPDALIFASLVPKLTGAKLVLDLHELMPELFTAEREGRIAAPLARVLRFLERQAVRFADEVLVANHAQLDVISARTRGRRYTFVPNVPDDSLFGAGAGRPDRPDPPVPTLVVTSTIARRYGIHVLIEALPHILARRPVRALVLGVGPDLAALRELAASLQVEHAVEFTGWVSPQHVPDYLAQSTVGIVPSASVYLDQVTPNKLFEFVAYDLPVVASDTPGVRAHFGDDAVQFFRSGDPEALAAAVLAVLASEERRQELTRNAAAVFATLRWELSKADYTDVFVRLSADPDGPAFAHRQPKHTTPKVPDAST
ncbi:MAG TPA: glycosyltransferase family 4 protein [Gaiellaceae bacterium]|nr:glycosyltransferase family 4 protein [Gaiellaceae bacterium]